MSLTLAEALGQVDLEAGRVYRCQVKGRWLEVRVLGPGEMQPSTRYDESDVMLDPWVEFPQPTSEIVVRTKHGSLPMPDVPEIPADGVPASFLRIASISPSTSRTRSVGSACRNRTRRRRERLQRTRLASGQVSW